MNENLKQILDSQLSGLEWTGKDMQALRCRMQSAPGKQPRKLTFALALALALVLMITAALAAASHAGLLDFVARQNYIFIPQDAQSYVQTNIASLENAMISATVRESYYDGRTLRMTIEVAPLRENALAIADTADLDTPWQELIHLTPEHQDSSDVRTLQDLAESCDVIHRISLKATESNPGDKSHPETTDAVLNPETGTLTFYIQRIYTVDRPQRDVTVEVTSVPYAGAQMRTFQPSFLRLELAVDSIATESPVYVCSIPTVFEQAGVRVDRLTLDVKPQEIYYTIEFTVLTPQPDTARHNWTAIWFEFVNMDEQANPSTRLRRGLLGTWTLHKTDDNQYVQYGAIGRNELREQYSLRALHANTQERFETHTFQMTLLPDD